jgi:nitrate reductase NapAB chaperone NapD
LHFSGILVATSPARMANCIRELESLPGVEVHHSYPSQGRLILVQETSTLAEQEQSLRRIQDHPEVLMAEPVYHCAEETDPGAPGEPAPPAAKGKPVDEGESVTGISPGTSAARPQEGGQSCE